MKTYQHINNNIPMKHVTITLTIFLLTLFINPYTISDEAEFDFTFVRLKYNGSYRYKSL